MEENGFDVDVENVSDAQLTQKKAELGVPTRLASCHTAVIDGYLVEGHVPADVIARLLEERPEAAGLAVPGMPAGSPGMEAGGKKDPYSVLLFDTEGNTQIYETR